MDVANPGTDIRFEPIADFALRKTTNLSPSEHREVGRGLAGWGVIRFPRLQRG
jgi:hypothetical protein